MENEKKEFIRQLIQNLSSIDYVRPQDIPNIDLYMDQITTFIDSELAGCKRYEDDKLLTKTMINNYAKNDLLPPPTKKKYSKEHLLTLIFIYYLKNIFSISDIQSILNPITEKYFGRHMNKSLGDIYDEIYLLEKEESEKVVKDLCKKYSMAEKTFTDYPEEDQKLLKTFSYICLLSYDVYIKKVLIEKMIDDMNGCSKEATQTHAYDKKK